MNKCSQKEPIILSVKHLTLKNQEKPDFFAFI